MNPEDIQKIVKQAIRDHEIRVALFSSIIGAAILAGIFHAVWTNHVAISLK